MQVASEGSVAYSIEEMATKKKPELSERTRRLLKRQEAQVTADKAEQRKQMRIQRLLRNLS